jgi:hypothetical protein
VSKIALRKTSFSACILADSEDCAIFAYITPLHIEIEKQKMSRLQSSALAQRQQSPRHSSMPSCFELGTDNCCEHTCIVAVATLGVILDREIRIGSHC